MPAVGNIQTSHGLASPHHDANMSSSPLSPWPLARSSHIARLNAIPHCRIYDMRSSNIADMSRRATWAVATVVSRVSFLRLASWRDVARAPALFRNPPWITNPFRATAPSHVSLPGDGTIALSLTSSSRTAFRESDSLGISEMTAVDSRCRRHRRLLVRLVRILVDPPSHSTGQSVIINSVKPWLVNYLSSKSN